MAEFPCVFQVLVHLFVLRDGFVSTRMRATDIAVYCHLEGGSSGVSGVNLRAHQSEAEGCVRCTNATESPLTQYRGGGGSHLARSVNKYVADPAMIRPPSVRPRRIS